MRDKALVMRDSCDEALTRTQVLGCVSFECPVRLFIPGVLKCTRGHCGHIVAHNCFHAAQTEKHLCCARGQREKIVSATMLEGF